MLKLISYLGVGERLIVMVEIVAGPLKRHPAVITAQGFNTGNMSMHLYTVCVCILLDVLQFVTHVEMSSTLNEIALQKK